jgi:hypothetical protein
MYNSTDTVPMAMIRISSYRDLDETEDTLAEHLAAIEAQAVAANLTAFFGGSLHFGQYRSINGTYRDAELFFPYSMQRFAELAALLPEGCLSGWSVDSSVAYVNGDEQHTDEWFSIHRMLNPSCRGVPNRDMFRINVPETLEWVDGCADEYEDRPAQPFTRADAERFDMCAATLLTILGEKHVRVVDNHSQRSIGDESRTEVGV